MFQTKFVDFLTLTVQWIWFLISGFLNGVRGEFTDNVSETALGPTAVSETVAVNSPRTPCKIPETRKQNL
jgi:hypothetical protein